MTQAVTPEVAHAIDQIRATVAPSPVTVREDGEGGAFVIVEGLPLGAPYQQAETWIGFRITFQYPYADCYPHFVRADLSRTDGKPLGDAITRPNSIEFEKRPAMQLSRRSNHLNPATDTAATKLLKVLQWLRTRP